MGAAFVPTLRTTQRLNVTADCGAQPLTVTTLPLDQLSTSIPQSSIVPPPVSASTAILRVKPAAFSRIVSPRTVPPLVFPTRSEERRVGKEGRSRWSPHH